ncbi:MAG: hypothetical protein ABR964_15780 [Tepidisphaeraceae bacterium]|jgi:hypothetical protein
MKSSLLWALVGLNALLLVSFIGRFTPSSIAAAPVHRPADYLLIPGEIQSGSTEVVYIVDTSNGMLGAMAYDESARQLNVMPPISLNSVFSITAPPR